MIISNVRYVSASQLSLACDIDGQLVTVPAVAGNRDYEAIVASGVAIAPYSPPAPTLADYGSAVEQHIDAAARANGYASAADVISYAGSTAPQWAADAAAFLAWRDAAWVYAYAQLAAVQAGQRAQPSVEALLAELPAMAWPTA